MLEANTNYSVGRGTDAPFEQIGSDWMQGSLVAETLNARFIPGVRVYPTRFKPAESNFAAKEIEGVRFVITNRESFDSTRLGIEVAATLEKLYPGKLNFEKCRSLIANEEVVNALKNGADAGSISLTIERQAREFAERRVKFLLY
jgi:uncharacterized protein YbbC (DUF1343 family)